MVLVKGDEVSLDLANVVIAVSRAKSVTGIEYFGIYRHSSFSGKRTFQIIPQIREHLISRAELGGVG